MRVAVCEIYEPARNRLRTLLEKYEVTKKTGEWTIDFYRTPMALNDATKDKNFYDIYILTMNMPGLDGIDLAKSIISELGYTPVIIYTTAFKDYALQAFEVHATRYLLKPVDEAEFFEALDNARSELKLAEQPFYLWTSANETKINTREIEYVECKDRRVRVILRDTKMIESTVLRHSFDEAVESLVCLPNFIRTHKSFVVNIMYVVSRSREVLMTKSGRAVPVSRQYQNAVRDYFEELRKLRPGILRNI